MEFCPQAVEWGNVADWATVVVTIFVGIIAAALTRAANRIATETHALNTTRETNARRQLEFELLKVFSDLGRAANRAVHALSNRGAFTDAVYREYALTDLAKFSTEGLSRLSEKFPILTTEASRAAQLVQMHMEYAMDSANQVLGKDDPSQMHLDFLELNCNNLSQSVNTALQSMGYRGR